MTEDRGDFRRMRYDTWQERRQRMDELVEYYIKLKVDLDDARIQFNKDKDSEADIESFMNYCQARVALQAVIGVLEILEINGDVEDLALEKIRER